MALVRCLTEMGMGVDVHGRDYTRAACRAVSDAIRHSSIGFFRLLNKSVDEMYVEVNIGIPKPAAVDKSMVAAELPHGQVTVNVVAGGLEVPDDRGNDAMVIANAAVLVSFDDDGPAEVDTQVRQR